MFTLLQIKNISLA